MILLPQFDPLGGGGAGVQSDWVLDSLHNVSCDLPRHFKALNATDNNMIGGTDEFKLSYYYLV